MYYREEHYILQVINYIFVWMYIILLDKKTSINFKMDVLFFCLLE